MSIIVIGSIFVDIKGYPLDTFIPDGRNAGRLEHVHGGVARNVAVDIVNAGGEATLVSLVNNDSTGEDVIGALRENGVDTSFIRAQEKGMGTWLAVFNENGDVASSISVRPDLNQITDIISEQQHALFENADAIVLEFDVEEETVRRTLAYAGKYNKKVIALVSVMSLALERKQYLPMVDCFICNRQEASMLLGDSFESLPLSKMPDRLTAYCCRDDAPSRMVVTLGSAGAVYGSGVGEQGHCPAAPVTVVDTTGAGDAFCAGLALALARRQSLKKACELGSRLAGSVITTTENVCKRED